MKSANTSNNPIVPDARNTDLAPPRTNNIIQIVVTKKTIKDDLPPKARAELIKLTEKIAEDAKSGALKGIGVIMDYPDGYSLGLEGSYLINPEAAIPPLMRLEHRVMRQVESNED